MKTSSHTSHTFTIPGADLEVTLPFEPAGAMGYKEPLVRVTDDQIILGYLVDDSDCANPLEDCDGMGHIYEARRNGPTLRQYEEARALGDYSDCKPNPYAVLLDVYEHGGIAYSLSGAGLQCRFDTARGGAVWVPDACLIEDIESNASDAERLDRARLCAKQAAEMYTSWRNGDCYGVVVVTYDKDGEEIEQVACWGFVGADHAYESLKSVYFPAEAST